MTISSKSFLGGYISNSGQIVVNNLNCLEQQKLINRNKQSLTVVAVKKVLVLCKGGDQACDAAEKNALSSDRGIASNSFNSSRICAALSIGGGAVTHWLLRAQRKRFQDPGRRSQL